MKKILVIEDDLMFCKLLSNYLNKNSYEANQAEDGRTAKKCLDEEDYDIVLIDYRLPDTNGLELSNWIIKNKPESKIIIMSRKLEDEIRQEAKDIGVVGFLNKPFNPSELLDMLKKMV